MRGRVASTDEMNIEAVRNIGSTRHIGVAPNTHAEKDNGLRARMPARILIPCLTVYALVSGCAHYTPTPIDPARSAQDWQRRALSDPGLRSFMEANSPEMTQPWPRALWDLTGLTLVAFYYHPSLDSARAQLHIAEAGEITAGARPNPSVGIPAEYTSNVGEGMSPWLLGFTWDIPMETAGKRRLRIAQAKHVSQAAQLQLAEAGWMVRSALRAALAEYLLSQRDLELQQAEVEARSALTTLMAQRLAAGEISRTELDAAQTQSAQAQVALHAVQGHLNEARIVLATTLGVPVTALDDLRFEWGDLEHPLDLGVLSEEAVQTDGLLNRLDVRRSLVDYLTLESALHLQIARQYPDLHWQPGFTFDQGEHRFALGVGFELPVLNRNEGPIAEATAQREKGAADFLALQSRVIGELHQARARYAAARAELAEIDTSLASVQSRTEQLTERAFELGEADRLAVASVRLQGILLARTRLDALRRTHAALGALEDAVQRPLQPATALPPIPSRPRAGTQDLK